MSKDKSKENKKGSTAAGAIMSAVHFVMLIFALYLSYRCNNGFNFGAFLMACCCPQIYIMYAAVFNGLCMVTGNRA